MSDNKKYYYMRLKENFFDDDNMLILESMPDGYLKRFLKIEISFIREIAKAAKPVNGQNERRISCAAVDRPVWLC